MSTGSILSILAYPQYGYHLICHTGLILVHCSYLSVGSLHHLTIGNLPSARHNSSGSMAVLLLALSPLLPKLSKSSKADQRQRKINADTLQDVFALIPVPLHGMAYSGVPIDYADGKVRLCFPILSAWILDHMKNVALHQLKSNACPKCEMLTHKLGTNAKNYQT